MGRRRLGLLVPSSNSVMEVDFYRHLPADVTLHTGRMYLEETTPEAEAVMLDEHAIPAARDVGTVRPHAIVFGCTSAGALRGNDADRALCDEVGAVTGSRPVSTIASVRAAIERSGARRIGVITPYVDALNEKIRVSIEADGVEVAGIFGLGITQNFSIAEVTPEEIVEHAVRSLGDLSIELAFASCTNFRAMDALEAIAEALGVPAISSNQAALEGALAALGTGG